MDIFEVKLIEVPDLFKVSIITGTSIIVNSDNTYNAIAYNGQTFVIPDTPWIDSDGTPMTSPATTPIVCSAPVGCDVENSDGTYDVHVNNGATLVIPDTTVKNTSGTTILVQPSATSTGVIADSVVTNSDNTFSLNVPAETNPELTDITHIDSDLTPVVLPAMTPFVATPAVHTYASAKLMKTGQTTSYRTGDDGDFEAGRGDSFFVLKENNPFGNTNRFTDELGGQTYTNNIVIDWSTHDGISVLGYYRNYLGNAIWEDQIDACLALSIGTFTSGWRLWNTNECMNVLNGEVNYNYAPFNISSFSGYCHTSSNKGVYCQKINVGSSFGYYLDVDPKVNGGKGMAVRTFNVNGTTLT